MILYNNCQLGQVSRTGERSVGHEEVNNPSPLLVEHPPSRCRSNFQPTFASHQTPTSPFCTSRRQFFFTILFSPGETKGKEHILRYVASCITLKSKSNWTLNVVPRVYIETKDGAKDEIGDGYSVGPGQSKYVKICS